MKKLLEFIKDNGLPILAAFVAILVIGGLVLPFFIAMARIAWDVAINNPSAIL